MGVAVNDGALNCVGVRVAVLTAVNSGVAVIVGDGTCVSVALGTAVMVMLGVYVAVGGVPVGVCVIVAVTVGLKNSVAV